MGQLTFEALQNKEYAKKDNPEFRLVTNDIEEVYKKVASKFPELLHPNLSRVTLRPWGAKKLRWQMDKLVLESNSGRGVYSVNRKRHLTSGVALSALISEISLA